MLVEKSNCGRENKQIKKGEHTMFVLFSRELFRRHIEHGALRETCVCVSEERFFIYFLSSTAFVPRRLDRCSPCVITCAEIKIGARFN